MSQPGKSDDASIALIKPGANALALPRHFTADRHSSCFPFPNDTMGALNELALHPQLMSASAQLLGTAEIRFVCGLLGAVEETSLEPDWTFLSLVPSSDDAVVCEVSHSAADGGTALLYRLDTRRGTLPAVAPSGGSDQVHKARLSRECFES